MTKYTVIIDPVDSANNSEIMLENVLEYRMLPDRVFYIAGSDFEQWFCLQEKQVVQVTEQEPNT